MLTEVQYIHECRVQCTLLYLSRPDRGPRGLCHRLMTGFLSEEKLCVQWGNFPYPLPLRTPSLKSTYFMSHLFTYRPLCVPLPSQMTQCLSFFSLFSLLTLCPSLIFNFLMSYSTPSNPAPNSIMPYPSGGMPFSSPFMSSYGPFKSS